MIHAGFFAFYLLIAVSVKCYRIGVGIADVTGPIAEVTFMGYAAFEQKGAGLHLRQFSRAFIVEDGNTSMVFISVDCGMIGNDLRKQVLKILSGKHGSAYNIQNVMISATHTHSAPGGYLMDLLFDASSLGFVHQTFDALVSGIVRSVERAHHNLKEGRIYVSQSELLNVNINRSPTAYLANPAEERAKYAYDVDKIMTQLKFVDSSGNGVGSISWYAVHPTSMNNTNKLVSTDNFGYASVLQETQMNAPGTLIGKGPFVAAFSSSNLGDVSPNIAGPRCEKTGNSCDVFTSKCAGKENCVAYGPGEDMFQSTRIIAQRLQRKSMELWNIADSREITGSIKSVHNYVHMPSEKAEYILKNKKKIRVRGCLPAMGQSFAAGTTDGPGLFDFKQGETMVNNPFWNTITNAVVKPSENQTKCHGIKPILLSTGEMHYPYEWQPTVVSTQLAILGDIAIACVPGEMTTMAGRRLRASIRTSLNLTKDENVIIAGLCNTYSDYITTPEEYKIQRYEGASTIYGPHTLDLYIKRYNILAALLRGRKVKKSKSEPEPYDFSNKLISLTPPVMFDSVPCCGYALGDCVQEPRAIVRPGETVVAKFISGHPRNDLKHDSTYLTIERFDENENWIVIATDANWETKFIWRRTSFLLGSSEVEIRWDVPNDARPGYYKIRHFGNAKNIFQTITPYQGASRIFKIVSSSKR